jgi:hypothetical protein
MLCKSFAPAQPQKEWRTIMKIFLGITIILCLSANILPAQDSSNGHSKNIESEKMELQLQREPIPIGHPDGVSPDQFCSLIDINNSLLELIKTYDNRDTIIQKLIDHEQAMSLRQVMADRLQLLKAILQKHTINKGK